MTPEKVYSTLIMLGILSVLIIVHECGHFLFARFFGFQTPVFGFGLPFGPYVALGRRWETEFRIYAFVMGGFVAIPELGDESNVSEDVFGLKLNPFKKFPIYQRMLVAAAGVLFNVIFAYILTVVMLYSVGNPTNIPTVLDLPKENPIAATAGVQKKDEIIAIDKTPMENVGSIIAYLGERKSTPVVLHLKRDGKPVDLSMTTNDQGRVGMALGDGRAIYQKVEGNPIEMCGLAYNVLTTRTGQMLQAMGQLFGNLVPHAKPKNAPKGELGLKDFHGVLAVIAIGGDMAQQDWRQLYIFTILISMDLAIVNLIPWPALDGGHLAFMTLEAIRRKPMQEQFQGEIVKWGFLSLLALMVVVMVNDVTALVTGQLDMTKKDKDKDQPAATSPANSSTPTQAPGPAPQAAPEK